MSAQESTEPTRLDKIKAEALRFYNTPAVRFTLVLTGSCLAAYLGGRSTMYKVEKNTAQTSQHLKNLVDFELAEANLREARAAEDRAIIGSMTEDGLPFTFYPGLGVLDHTKIAPPSDKKRS